MACLKLKPDCGGAAFGSAIGVHPEKHLPELYGLAVFDRDLPDSAGQLRLDLVHDLHRLDDANGLARGDPVAHLDVRLGPRLGRFVKGAHHGGSDLFQLGRGGGGTRTGLPMFRVSSGRGRRRHYHWSAGRNGRSGSPGNHHPGAEPAFDLDGADLRSFSKQLGQSLHVLQVDGVNTRNVLQQLGELLHLLWAHTRVKYLSSRRSTRITWPSSMKSGTCTVAPVSRVAGLVPPVAVSPRTPGAVRVTVSSTNEGSSTVMTRSSCTSPSHSMPSFRYLS